MRKLVLLCSVAGLLVLSSCGAKKKIAALENKNNQIQSQLNNTQNELHDTKTKLSNCLTEKDGLNQQMGLLRQANADLKQNNSDLISNIQGMTTLTAKGAANLEKSLESMREKDLRINRLQDALSRKDSVTLALVTSLKREVGINDPDIEVNVEKGVVYISIADKLLFKTGSYEVSSRARDILKKVATVVNAKPDFECMVEGHTDNVPYRASNGVLLDNWDLSVKRSTSVIRVLQELGVNPSQLVAAGRGEYNPLVVNDSDANKARNRRTRILVLPRIDQFYDMIEREMKTLGKQ